LGIPHYVLDFEDAFRRNVIDRFAGDYAAGRTPNPCVSCNNFVKLGTLRRFADRIGARFIATGHYARVQHDAEGVHLYAGESPEKDQSYALAQLAPAQLSGLLLPLGNYTKEQTRRHAERLSLPVYDKPESQDICFVEGDDYRTVLARYALADNGRGNVVTAQGDVVGTHSGIAGYTVGQRRGLPPTHFNDGPRYVTRIDATTNTLVIGREEELGSSALEAGKLNLIRPERFAGVPVRVHAMTRYRSPRNAALATIDGGRLYLEFERPERAVAPGQLVALYDPQSSEVLGGATITEAS
jgi:tRNA-specific 2-thiouridylase